MIYLTQKEKADRFDALQAAFTATYKRWKERQEESRKIYDEAFETSIIGAYNKGLSDAYKAVIDDLERWIV